MFKNLKYIKLYDILSIFIFLLLVIPALIYKLYLKITRQRIWLITEEGLFARDNGYYFFEYAAKQHDVIRKYYVISKKSHDYNKVNRLGRTIQFRGVRHWIYYMSSEYNISSQKHGNPAQALFYVLHVKLNLFNNRVFLQHGITKDKSDWILYKNTKFKYFVCGAEREYRYIKDDFGYPDGSVINTGFPRFDSLIDESKNKKQILIMPTWRNWLGRDTNGLAKSTSFMQSDYYKNWNGLINDSGFIAFVEKNNIDVKFYPHVHMQKYLDCFTTKSKNVEILSTETDIQTIMRKSSIMLTDYSSVAMDFAYMRKPIVYFQFDKKEYRDKQLQQGYFDYDKDGFGPVVATMNAAAKTITKSYRNGRFNNDGIFLKRIDSFFNTSQSNSRNNCARLYSTLAGKKIAIDDKGIKYSIIIPAYNCEKYIGDCIKSLLDQSYRNFEAIIIDDGSSDNTLKVATRECMNDKRFAVIRQSHLGPNLARKTGVRVASGEYTIFLDSDDLLRSDTLELLSCHLIENPSIDIVHFGMSKYPSGKTFNPVTPTNRDNYYIPEKDIIQKLVFTYQLNSINNQVYRTSLLKKLKALGSTIRYGEDLLINAEVFETKRNVYIISAPLYLYRYNRSSTTKNDSYASRLRNAKDRVIVSKRIIELANHKSSKGADLTLAVLAQYNMLKHVLVKLYNSTSDTKTFIKDVTAIMDSKDYKDLISVADLEKIESSLKAKPINYRLRNRRIFEAIHQSNAEALAHNIRKYGFAVKIKEHINGR